MAAPAAAQTPIALHAAFAACEHGDGPPAIAWLRHQVLATQPNWPSAQSARAAFSLHSDGRALLFGDGLQLPPGLAVAGEFVVGDATVRFSCSDEGRESWEIAAAAVPASLEPPMTALNLALDAPPRTLDVATLLGNLLGAAVDGDRGAQLAAIGAAQCGELTLAIRRTADGLRATGRSGGGLLVPAALLWYALHRDTGRPPVDPADAWRLRAFGGRDGDRPEAARQLQRSGAAAVPALRSLLHADEPSRIAAIDALVRLHAASELPFVVAAADDHMPLCVDMARTALRELWPLASQTTRTATLVALHRSPVLDASAVAPLPLTAPADPRYRWLALLAIGFAALLGLWMRERTQLQTA